MAHDSGYLRIWAEPTDGLGINEVAAALDDSGSLDVGTLCTHQNVNKWAKYKPIRFPKWGALTEEEFKGRLTDISSGIFYGVRLSSDNVSRYDLLHDVAFDYYPPEGDENSPYRLLDFNNYCKNVFATLSGEMPEKIYYDLDDPIGIRCRYSYDNYAVDYADVLGGEETLKNSYPCIIVSNYARTVHYMCALKTNTGLDYEVLPMYNAGEWTETFYCDFSDTKLALLQDTNIHITLFIVHNSGPQSTSFPIDGEWHQYRTDRGYANRGYAVPGAVNKETIFDEKYITANPEGCGADISSGLALTYRQTKAKEIPAGELDRREATIIDTRSGRSVTRKLGMNVPSYLAFAVVPWSDFGIIPSPDMPWSIRTYVTYYYTDGKQKIGEAKTYSGTF